MKNLKLIALYAMCSIAVLSSCKKDKDDPAPAPTKTQLLTNKNWNKVSISANTADGASFTGPVEECEKDDIEIFMAASATAINGTRKTDPKAIKCNDLESETTSTWEFNAAQTEILIGSEFMTGKLTFKIVELTSTSLKLSYTMKDPDDGKSYTYTFNYIAK